MQVNNKDTLSAANTSPHTNIHVFSAATAQCLFARGQGPHNPEYMFQYWGAMSACLTKLKLAFDQDVTAETSSALNQLAQLKGLLLEGVKVNAATIHLQLPQLTKMTLSEFGSTTVSLDCPQPNDLKLIGLAPLQEINRLPEGIEYLTVDELAAGSMPIEQMLPAQGLQRLSHLALHDCPGNPMAVREAYVASTLVQLRIDHPWAPLLPSQPPWQGLPCHLRFIALQHPLDDGIPLVLEQLRSLLSLEIYHVGPGPMHLTRPLDPFLDMARLYSICLSGDEREEQGFNRWTPAALGLLGLADRRIQHMARGPGARYIITCH